MCGWLGDENMDAAFDGIEGDGVMGAYMTIISGGFVRFFCAALTVGSEDDHGLSGRHLVNSSLI